METKDSQQAEPAGDPLLPEESSPEEIRSHQPGTTESNKDTDQAAAPDKLIVAGVGASAGGLQALQTFFEAMPENLGIAFVIIVHLSPEHRSYLGEILTTCTTMPVQQVQGSVALEGNHIYVIPPDRQLQIDDRTLAALPFEEPHGQRSPIDSFFRSLAEQHGDCFAVILSGGGSDGAVGVKAVKERGGLILVQEPREAAHEAMPRAAIATGVADFILPVRELATRLADLTRSKRRVGQILNPENLTVLEDDGEQTLGRILAYLHSRTGHDFSGYKRSTVLRRLGRRMQIHHNETLGDYLAFLRRNTEETQALFNDLLIVVTTFFRDPEAFQALQQEVLGRLLEAKDKSLRIWVPGCASGEEAYSLMILLLEEAERRNLWPEVQLFASDLDENALARAREGRYPIAIEADVSPDRLRRFFVKESDHYRVVKEIRNRVVFAAHSLLRDPPFSRLDLISCRNLLIYLDRELQEQVFGIFHYALRQNGYLFLGISEVAEAYYFRPLDKKHHLFQARELTNESPPHLPGILLSPPRPLVSSELERVRREPSTPALHQTLLEALAPPSVLVNEQRMALHFSETAGRFLQQPGGPATQDLTELVRRELQTELRIALYQALERGETSLSPFIPVQFSGTLRQVATLVQPRPGDAQDERRALVIFLDGGEVSPAEDLPANDSSSSKSMSQLQMELQRMQRQMRTMREEYEAASEEFRAANEELISLNEEYRVTTEELETSKEELQSLNEELETVNSELKHRLDEITWAHSDMENLIAVTEIGILFLDINLHIHRFTPRLTDIFSVTSNDRNRPIGDFTHHLDYDQLEVDAQQVLATLTTIEHELRSQEGRWYLTRLRPYRTIDNRIGGVVVTFVDITERKRAEQEIRAAQEYAESIVETVHEPIIILNSDLRIRSANQAFYEQFIVTPDQTEDRPLYELGNQQWDIPELRSLLEDVLPENHIFEDYEVTHNFENIGQRTMLLSGRRLAQAQCILLAIKDITERKEIEDALRVSEERLRRAAQIETVGIIFFRTDGSITRANDAFLRMSGYNRAELEQSLIRWDEIIPSEWMPHFLEAIREFEERGYTTPYEREYIHKDGSRRWALFAATRLDAVEGVEYMIDITTLKQAEQALLAAHEELEARVENRTADLSRAVVALEAEISERRRIDREKTHLLEVLQQQQQRLRALAGQLAEVQEKERKQLARELHDRVGQSLTALGLNLNLMGAYGAQNLAEEGKIQASVEDSLALVDQMTESIRDVMAHLRPPVLDDYGLVAALRWYGHQVATRANFAVTVQGEEPEPRLPEPVEHALFRIAQEALTNATKHAQASHVILTLETDEGTACLTIRDDGIGFEVALPMGPGQHQGWGLVSMAERAEAVGGHCRVDSIPGDGTQVIVEVPR